MKIIGFTASPRKEGNTAWVINKILEGAKEQGAETQSWYFSDLDIKPCRSCFGCKNGDKGCVINDDMQKLYNTLVDTDAIVFGSPLYMGQMSAQAKIFIDRLYAVLIPDSRRISKGNAARKKMVLVFTQGSPDQNLFQVYYDYTKKIFQMLGFDVKDVHIITGMGTGPAHERKDLYSAMRGAGSSLVLE
jgi:multimeric flavodoxin WrbA